MFNKHCHSTTIRLNNTCFILHFHLDSEPMQAAHDSTVRPLQNVSTHLQGVHVLKRTRQSWTLAKWTYVMDLQISVEVKGVKSITWYTALAASHFNGKTIHCYCGLNSAAKADTSSAAHSKPLPFRQVTCWKLQIIKQWCTKLWAWWKTW